MWLSGHLAVSALGPAPQIKLQTNKAHKSHQTDVVECYTLNSDTTDSTLKNTHHKLNAKYCQYKQYTKLYK